MSKNNGQSYYDRALKIASKKNADLEYVFSLLTKALNAGNPNASYALGTWYLHGKYVKKNIRKAIFLIRQAAKYNVPDALYDLAISYANGTGVKKNLRLSMEYFLRAALHGDKESIYEVGRSYYHGIGIEKNRRLASIWLDYAKELGVKSL